MNIKIYLVIFLYLITTIVNATTATIAPTEIIGYDAYPPNVKKLLNASLALTKQNLTYLYGSANPAAGGMDCSGTIYYLLKQMNVTDVPRQSNEMYTWATQHGKFYPVTDSDFSSKQFAHLQAGDLLFWTGTYAIKRTPPITHVMIYLGKNKEGKPFMVGASDGRTFYNKKMWGVSVFDFKLPAKNSTSHFIGYSCIPTINCQ